MSDELASILLHNTRPAIDEAETRVLSAMERMGYPESARFAVRLAMEEAIANAFNHGHRDLPGEPILLQYHVSPTELELIVEDKGPGFSPSEVPDPTLDENLELPTGRGLLLMRAFMTRIEYNDRGNRVRMLFGPGEAPAPTHSPDQAPRAV